MLNEYVFSVSPWGREISVAASSEKEARRIAWDSMPDSAKDNAESMECVDGAYPSEHKTAGVTATQFGATQ